MLKVKAGVTPQNLVIAAAAANVAEALGITLVITSGMDGKHMVGSRHYIGQALDLRRSNLTKPELATVLKALKTRLGKRYDVVLESDHIHVEVA
jgi:hypothetical protein